MEMIDCMAEKRLLERRSVDFSPLNVGARGRKSMALLTVLNIGASTAAAVLRRSASRDATPL
ncbi:MAG: hypothetical protein EOR84_13475 [Mesorhizobium sp.]|uniref:hypothetical protein n=1 Tax=Mesorhizobium sp. TaxID=1871066 RepID=UPI000FE7E392|nr:hypothetical protein [Mesorhizobium sp.]RWM96599.1 MAG: hypothetical protein EOR84_13475 [Mesorhizobium sp.]